MQLAQLLLVDRARRVGEQVLRALRLREGDHVAQRLGAGHQHHEAVEADGDAAVRRRAVLQRVEQEAELGARFLGVDLERAEHLALHVLAVDPHRAAAELEAVQDDVVGLGDAAPGVGLEPVLVAVLRARERMVHRAPALLALVVLEHREVDHPERLPLALHQAARLAELAVADLDAQGAEGVVDDRSLVGAEEDHVAVLRAGAREDFGERRVVQVLDDRRLQAFAPLGDVVDLDPGQALGAVDLDELGVAVDLAPAHLAAARHAQRHDAAALGLRRRREDLEVDVGHDVGELGQLELDAQVGLVGAVAAHRLLVGHHRKRRQLDADRVLDGAPDHRFEHRPDLFLVEERGLDVDLGELGLAIGAQVLVAEALGDLVVAVEAGDHQQLLEELRALRQREEHAVVDAARHEVVARAFGRALGEHRRLDVDEAVASRKRRTSIAMR